MNLHQAPKQFMCVYAMVKPEHAISAGVVVVIVLLILYLPLVHDKRPFT